MVYINNITSILNLFSIIYWIRFYFWKNIQTSAKKIWWFRWICPENWFSIHNESYMMVLRTSFLNIAPLQPDIILQLNSVILKLMSQLCLLSNAIIITVNFFLVRYVHRFKKRIQNIPVVSVISSVVIKKALIFRTLTIWKSSKTQKPYTFKSTSFMDTP